MLSGPSPDVSMILVQVKNHEGGYSSLTSAVTDKLDPQFVFQSTNPLSHKAPHDVLRVLMCLREPKPRHAYVQDPLYPEIFGLCLFGLQSWSSCSGNPGSAKVVVVSDAVAKELKEVLNPWWRVDKTVVADLEKCPERRKFVNVEEAKENAVRPLADTLILNQPMQRVEMATKVPTLRADRGKESTETTEKKGQDAAGATEVPAQLGKRSQASDTSDDESS